MHVRTTVPARALVRAWMVMALVVAALVGLGGPAIAKGPESATITDPWVGEPIDLMCDGYADPVLRLVRHTGV
jgi:hypothetical protein